MLYLPKQKEMVQTGLKEMTEKKQLYTEATPEQQAAFDNSGH